MCGEWKIVNGRQCTLVWYVDGNKVSYMEEKPVEDLINYLIKHFVELIVIRVKKHTFLGTNINITQGKKFEIDMKEKFLEAIEAFGENIDRKVTTPESSHIFIVNKQAE